MKYVIEVDYEITNCNVCPIYLNEFGHMSADFCILLEQNTDEICELKEKLPNCPLKPLKPKQLEWIEFKDGCLVSDDNLFRIGKSTSKVKDEEGNEYEEDNYWITLNWSLYGLQKTLEEAKDFCQKDREKRFYEMIGE